MIAKNKPIRITGRKLAELNATIHQRDSGCILCRRWVDPGEKFHHEPGGINKVDDEKHGVTLCMKCHGKRHFGPGSTEVRDKIVDYLNRFYGVAK